LDVALTYYRAWTGGDLAAAWRCLADDVVCDAPAGRLVGVAAYRDFLGPFAGSLRSATLLSAFGDDDTALIMYDTASELVASAPAAERLTVRDGLIVHNRFVFDRAPFQAARAAREAGAPGGSRPR
jgi:ketosteroid isomerase-like protein